MDGNMIIYIARLVAKDYEEIFSSVSMFKTIQMFLAIIVFHDYEIWLNVKTAFLNGNLEDGVYMIHLIGFEDPKNAGKVCKLFRSIYGLNQALRS
jgi:Reverse transcriptase (RNA-dependent DNA polymerase)